MMGRGFLILIILLAFALRFFSINTIPFGFTPDEASFGYDAYSILKTGKDQWGHSFPLVLESFGDFKPPLYSYLTIPSVLIFGLNKYSVRLPNALIGTAAVYITYLLVRELRRLGNKNLEFRILNLEFIASLMLAISPWHVMLSRGAFESNLTSFFMSLGILFFIKGLKSKNYLILSSLAFGLNLFSYHSARLVTPLIFTFLFLIFRRELRGISPKVRIFSMLVFALFLSSAFYTLLIGGARRAQDISIFSGSVREASEQRSVAIFSKVNPIVARLLHNKYQVLLRRFVDNYLQYFSFEFLFVSGPREATYGMLPGRGVLYWFELPLFIGFLYYLFKNWKNRVTLLIVFWLLVAPIPAALAQGVGYAANRAATMLPVLQIALAFGAYTLQTKFLSIIKDVRLVRLGIFIYSITILLSIFYFFEDYFLVSPLKSANSMLYGNLEAMLWLRDNSIDKEKIIVSTRLSEPHIYVAFANSWDPSDYQKYSKAWQGYKRQNILFLDQLPVYRLGKYAFRRIEYSNDRLLTNSLLVGRPDEFPKEVFPIKSISYPNGGDAVLIVAPGDKSYAFRSFKNN